MELRGMLSKSLFTLQHFSYKFMDCTLTACIKTNAKLIGLEVGRVYKDTISKKSIVSHRYLQLWVDTPINGLLLASFI